MAFCSLDVTSFLDVASITTTATSLMSRMSDDLVVFAAAVEPEAANVLAVPAVDVIPASAGVPVALELLLLMSYLLLYTSFHFRCFQRFFRLLS